MAKYYEENSNDVNRCRRCNGPLSDPNDKYGWWCAKLLGYGDHQNDSHELDYDNLNVYNEDISTNSEASSSDLKLFSNTANISSNIYYQMGVDNYYFINDVQKNIQREFWKAGTQKYLREEKEFYTSAWMFEHSLQDNPEDIWRGNDSRIAYLINNDPSYLNELDKAIANSKDGWLDNEPIYVKFKTGDLYYSIHKGKYI